MTTSSNEVLHQLAEAAGVSCHWQDHRGIDRTVSPDVLQSVLNSLELPAESSAHCKESLEQLKISEENEIPSLTTGRVHQPLVLPPALQKRLASTRSIQLHLDQNHSAGSNSYPLSQTIELQQSHTGEICLPSIDLPGYYTLEAGSTTACLAIAPTHCRSVAEVTGNRRSFGLAAQIYSLRTPGDGGIGSYSALRDLARQCGEAGAQALAMSPVHALFSADETRYSPYAPSSRLFLNVLYIDPAAVLGHELMASCVTDLALHGELIRLEHEPLIDWPHAARAKLALLRCLWTRLNEQLLAGAGVLGQEFQQFCQGAGEALRKHAVFETLHAQQFQANPNHWHWRNWPTELRDPESGAVKQFAKVHESEVAFHMFLQWLAAKSLTEAQSAGREAGMSIGLIADLAIGTDSGGSHAWSRQSEMLNGLSVGAPPDMMSHRGQNWGLTTFSPRALKAHDYKPFLEMLRASLRYAGGLRIDHVLGLRRLWLIPEGVEAIQGAYLRFPQTDLLNLIALESWQHNAVIVGEDLGTIPSGFREEISEVGLLGMQVMWFEKNHGLFTDPSRWRTNAMATTTTHDLPTVAGWWQGKDIEWNQKLDRFSDDQTFESEKRDREKEKTTLWAAFDYAGVAGAAMPPPDDPQAAVDSAVAFVAKSASPLVLVPVEDMLGLDEQPNLPGTVDEHPNWRRRLEQPATELLNNKNAAARMSVLRKRCTTKGERGGLC